jgi:hypothetical protein
MFCFLFPGEGEDSEKEEEERETGTHKTDGPLSRVGTENTNNPLLISFYICILYVR